MIETFIGYDRMSKEYEKFPKEQELAYTALGLTGEAGEYADKIKKVIRDHDGYIDQSRQDGLIKELGDVLWYVSAAARALGVTLSVVATKNLEKLESRKQRGVLKGSGDNR